MNSPDRLPNGEPEKGAAAATQLSILLAAETALIDEEFKRSERLDAKSRNQLTVTGTFFTVVQAITIGLINGALAATDSEPTSSFVMWLAVAGAVAGLGMAAALTISHLAWRLRDDSALGPNTIRTYLDAARDGDHRRCPRRP